MQGFRPKSPPYEGPVDFRPYPVGYVELPAEVKVESLLVDVEPHELAIDMPMELVIVPFPSSVDGRAARHVRVPSEAMNDQVAERRIDATLVCGGKYHDFDYARLRLLELLAEDEHVRVAGGLALRRSRQHHASRLPRHLHVRRPADGGAAAGDPPVGAGGWPVARAPRHELRARSARQGAGGYIAPRTFPVWADTLGSQFLSHPPIEPYLVRGRPRRRRPLVAGIESFESRDELYLMEHHGDSSRCSRRAGPERLEVSPRPNGPTTNHGWCCTGVRSVTARSSTSRSATVAATGT